MTRVAADRRYLVTAGVLLGLSVFAYLVFGRPVIAAIYDGRLPGLSGLLGERATQPLSFYLHVFDKLALAVLAVELIAILLVGLATDWIRFANGASGWLISTGVVIAVVLMLVSVGIARMPTAYAGDASEYFQMSQSFWSHWTPDLRPSDEAAFASQRLRLGMVGSPPLNGYEQSPIDGRWYSVHFWLFSLLAVPFGFMLRIVGADWTKSFAILNVLAFFGSIGALLLIARLEPMKRAVFVLLLVFSPILWYLSWPSPEVVTGALVILSIATFTREKYALATLFAAIAAVQNMPIAVLVATYLAYAGIKRWRTRDIVGMALLVLAASVILIPMLFYLATFHNLSPLATGFTGWDNISKARVFGFFVDLDMGLVPYLPFVTLGFAYAVLRAILRIDWWTLLRSVAVIGMVVLSATTARGWNSAAIGLMRYGVWILPVVVWVMVDALPAGRRDAAIAAVVVTMQVAMLLASQVVSIPGQSNHSLFGKIVLARASALYCPPAEEFTERSLGQAVSATEFQPVAFFTGNSATKVLADRDHISHLDRYYVLSGVSLGHLKLQGSDAHDLYYVNFKPGQATRISQETSITDALYRLDAEIGGPTSLGPSDEMAAANVFNMFPKAADGSEILAPLATYPLYVTIPNSSPSTWYPAGSRAIGVSIRLVDAEGRAVPGSQGVYSPLLQAVFPGQTTVMYPSFVTPASQGSFRLLFQLVQLDARGTTQTIPSARSIVKFRVEDTPPLSR